MAHVETTERIERLLQRVRDPGRFQGLFCQRPQTA
jgi:hypothetical protein